MSLAAGQTLSFYEILGPLGAGAMGEVYRAKDTRLDREVAIKVLPEHFADDEERLRRFEREAKSIAALNHPNVAQIHSVDQVEDTCFLVLELVPGETLEYRIARGALPLDEALDVCCQIADGLEAAHEAGVIHRDLKPANVRITPDGKVKVLDFGLAKPTGPDADVESTTDSVLATEEGRLLGTPTYMAPEQARGKHIDRRVDVWAFGCVLFECLTGKRAFDGETIADVIARVLEDAPRWERLPPETPVHVREVLERCLAKDPRERLRDVGDASLLLTGPFEAGPKAASSTPRRSLVFFVAGALSVSALWLCARLTAELPPDANGRPYHFGLEMGPEARDTWIAPDGTSFVYWQDEALYLRRLDEDRSRLIPGTEGAWVNSTCWSPDSRSIVFGRGGSLETLELGEAKSVRRCRVAARPSFVSWSRQDALLFEIHATPQSDGLYLHRAGAAEVEPLDWIDVAQQVSPDLSWPSFLPDGDRFLVTLSAQGEDPWIHVASLEARNTRPLVPAQTRAEYVAPGWLAWLDRGRLLVQAFDAQTAELSGAPRELVGGVDGFVSTGSAKYRFSAEGTLAYWPVRPPSELEWFSRDGRHLGAAAAARPYEIVRLDPDGTRIATTMTDPTTGSEDLWLIELGRDTPRRLTRLAWPAQPLRARGRRKGSARARALRRDGAQPRQLCVRRPAGLRQGEQRRHQRPVGRRHADAQASRPARNAFQRAGPGAHAGRTLDGLRLERDGAGRGVRHLFPRAAGDTANLHRRRDTAALEGGRIRALLYHREGRHRGSTVRGAEGAPKPRLRGGRGAVRGRPDRLRRRARRRAASGPARRR